MIRYGSVCSGIESASVAWHPLGWTPVWFAENDKAPARLLEKRFPSVVNLGDMTALPAMVRAGEIEAPDVLVGGTPCQDFSVAGMRRGLAGARGQLTMTYVELADAIDEQRPGDECVVCWENVPGVLNHKDNPFGNFLAALAGEDVPLVPPGKRWTDAGVVVGPRRTIAWRCLDAQYFGLAQRRKRVFVVASARDGFDPAAVLLEREGARRDFAPSREAGQSIAGTLNARTEGGGFPGTDEACSGYAVPVCPTLRAGGNSTGGDRPPGTDVDTADSLIVLPFDTTQVTSKSNYSKPKPGDPCHPLAAGAHPPAIAFNGRMDPCVYGEQTGALDTDALTQCIAFMGRGSNLDLGQNVTGTLTGNIDRASGSAPCVTVALRTRDGCATAELGGDVAYALKAGDGGGASRPYALQHMAVRRLMPVECERLQGFPDGWTAGQADGPRYKQLGNSKAVPVVRWIGRRLDAEYRLTPFQRQLRALVHAFD